MRVHIIAALLLTSALHAPAAQDTSAIPTNVFLLGTQMQAAKTAAETQQKPIALIYADPYTAAPTKRYANTTYIEGLKTQAVIVIGCQPKNLPPLVAKDLRIRFANAPDATTRAAYVSYERPNNPADLPIVYLMDAACQKILFATNGSTEIRSRLKPIQQKIAEYVQANTAASEPAATSPALQPQRPTDIPGLRAWKSSNGVSINAAFVEASDGFVTLQRQDGRTLQIMLQNLSAADQMYLASAHGIRAPEPEPENAPTQETAPANESPPPTEETSPVSETATTNLQSGESATTSIAP